MPNSSLLGPALALLALGVVVLVCRWVFAPPVRRAPARRASTRGQDDFGLLVPVVTARTATDAEAVRQVLRSAGIRCTVTDGAEGTTRLVLVFRSDAERATELVRS